jgi:lipopolysaccharide/colanic/teichoic acid biosynthesis glycosyltransferase
MRLHSPTSRTKLGFRVSAGDMVVAALSPYAALYLRQAAILSDNYTMVVVYCTASLVFSLLFFLVFRIDNAIPRYLSVSDGLTIGKSVACSEFTTAVFLFSIMRLDGVPRSVPAIHALVLGAGLLAARLCVRIFGDRRQVSYGERENLILIGLNDLSAIFVKLFEALTPDRYRVIAFLDPDPSAVGRSVNGIRVFGPPADLSDLIDEFAVHGVRADRVVIAGEIDPSILGQLRRTCDRLKIGLTSVQDLLSSSASRWAPAAEAIDGPAPRQEHQSTDVSASPYFWWKSKLEFLVALGLTFLTSPFLLVASFLALIDVGPPIFFWQHRPGLRGRTFQLYKIRTLRSLFDQNGGKVPEGERLSPIGKFLRRTRFDELPQLLNVLVGDMSLIGPRPLLPEDQPGNEAERLAVRPGITGWAQVNGGVLLSAQEKAQLDLWYIRHASLSLDLRIAAKTLGCIFFGDRRSVEAIVLARDSIRDWRSPRSHGLDSVRIPEGQSQSVGSLLLSGD